VHQPALTVRADRAEQKTSACLPAHLELAFVDMARFEASNAAPVIQTAGALAFVRVDNGGQRQRKEAFAGRGGILLRKRLPLDTRGRQMAARLLCVFAGEADRCGVELRSVEIEVRGQPSSERRSRMGQRRVHLCSWGVESIGTEELEQPVHALERCAQETVLFGVRDSGSSGSRQSCGQTINSILMRSEQ
jgi:hypothetical protein